MKSVTSKGKDVSEAVSKGIKLLETTESDIIVEIIRQPKEGFFGLSSKKAIVKITRKDDKRPNSEESHLPDDVEEPVFTPKIPPMRCSSVTWRMIFKS